MKAIAGSIVILAGAVIIAAGVIGQDVCQANNRFPIAGNTAVSWGGFLVLVGIVVTVLSFVFEGFVPKDRPHRTP